MENNNHTASKFTLHAPSAPDGAVIQIEPSEQFDAETDALFLYIKASSDMRVGVHLDEDDTYEFLDAVAKATGAHIEWHGAEFGEGEGGELDEIESAVLGL